MSAFEVVLYMLLGGAGLVFAIVAAVLAWGALMLVMEYVKRYR